MLYDFCGVEIWRSRAFLSGVEELMASAMACLCTQAETKWHFGEIASCRGTLSEAKSLAKKRNNMRQGLKEAAINPAPQPVHAMEAQRVAAMSHNTLNDLKNIKCPVLVIAGKDDAFTPRWMSEETAANIPGSDLHLYDYAGHAFHLECMNDFNPRTTEWLLKH
jgi:pimeloyl-ACP methyl ester carboxylesterase